MEKAVIKYAPRVVRVKYLLGLVEVNKLLQGSIPLSMSDEVEVKGPGTGDLGGFGTARFCRL